MTETSIQELLEYMNDKDESNNDDSSIETHINTLIQQNSDTTLTGDQMANISANLLSVMDQIQSKLDAQVTVIIPESEEKQEEDPDVVKCDEIKTVEEYEKEQQSNETEEEFIDFESLIDSMSTMDLTNMMALITSKLQQRLMQYELGEVDTLALQQYDVQEPAMDPNKSKEEQFKDMLKDTETDAIQDRIIEAKKKMQQELSHMLYEGKSVPPIEYGRPENQPNPNSMSEPQLLE